MIYITIKKDALKTLKANILTGALAINTLLIEIVDSAQNLKLV